MDDPLVPESLKGNAKYCVYGGVGSVLLFVVITIIMTVVMGSKKGHPAWFVLALAMLGFFITTLVMLNWLRQNTVEDKMKYVVGGQLLMLVLMSIAAMIDILRKETECDPCIQIPSACHVAITSGLAASQCAVGQAANCGSVTPLACFEAAGWASPTNGSLNVIWLNQNVDSYEPQLYTPALSPLAVAAAAMATAKPKPYSVVADPLFATPKPVAADAEDDDDDVDPEEDVAGEALIAAETDAALSQAAESARDALELAVADATVAAVEAKLEELQAAADALTVDGAKLNRQRYNH